MCNNSSGNNQIKTIEKKIQSQYAQSICLYTYDKEKNKHGMSPYIYFFDLFQFGYLIASPVNNIEGLLLKVKLRYFRIKVQSANKIKNYKKRKIENVTTRLHKILRYSIHSHIPHLQ